jgi:hypothetical protein
VASGIAGGFTGRQPVTFRREIGAGKIIHLPQSKCQEAGLERVIEVSLD